jgi:hypothetical protein
MSWSVVTAMVGRYCHDRSLRRRTGRYASVGDVIALNRHMRLRRPLSLMSTGMTVLCGRAEAVSRLGNKEVYGVIRLPGGA